MLPLTLQVAQVMDLVPRAEVPDMPDRIVAATAVAYKLPLVSQDSEVRDSASLKALVPIIWQQYGRILAESTTGGLLAVRRRQGTVRPSVAQDGRVGISRRVRQVGLVTVGGIQRDPRHH